MTTPHSATSTSSRRRLAILAGSIAALLGSHSASAAAVANNFTGGATGDLTSPANWSLGHVPTVGEDAVFPAGTVAGIRNFGTGATPGTNLVVGSLDDLAVTGTVTLQNQTSSTSAATITLGGSGWLGNSVSGTPADLFYVASGGTFNITGPGTGSDTLGLVLGQSGNFNVAGTSTISAAITSTGTANLTRTGAGSLTLSGGINNVGTFTNSGTAPAIYPSIGIAAAPAGSTYINGTVGSNVTGIIQNGTSDLVLNNLGATYNNGITIQNGAVLFSTGVGTNPLGAATNTIFLGNGSTTTNATMDFAGNIGGSGGANKSFANPVTVGSKAGEGVNVISASDFNLTLSGPISLTGGDLTLAPFNTGGSSITITGGITGTGNLFVSNLAGNANNVVNLTTGAINNTGTLTFNNATVNGVTASGNTGTNTVSANIGSNVTGVIQNSTDPLTLSGTNTYTGSTTILRGTINETNGSISAPTLNIGPGTFNYSKTGGTQSFTTTNLTGNGVISNTIASTTLNLGTITHSSTTTPGAVNFANTTGAITTTNTNDASGILAPWATTGTGTALNYAVSNGGSSAITAYTTGTNQAALTTAGGGTAGTTNFTLGNASVTLAASSPATGNTLQVLNGDTTGITLALGANNLTLNGILNSGGTGGSLTISGGGKLFIGANNELDISNNAQSTTISSIIADNGATASSVVYSPVGAGTLTLSGANTYTGGTFVNSGTVNIGSTTTKLGTGAVTLAAGTTLSTNAQNATESTFAPGGITGAGNFTASGGAYGIITLDRINTYTGTTNVGGARNAIKVNIASTYDPVTGVQTGSALGLNSPVNIAATVNQSALWLNGNNITVGTITGGNSTNQSTYSGIILGKAGTGTSAALTVGGDNGSGTFVGNISDAAFFNAIAGLPQQGSSTTGGSIIKIGTGTQTLSPGGSASPYNNYGGPTVVNGGTLAGGSTEFYATGVDKGGAFGLNSNVTVNSLTAGTTASLAINSTNVAAIGSLTFGGTGATATSTNNVSIGSGLLLLGGNVTADATNNPLGATITATASQGVLELGASRTFTVGSSSNSGGADLTIGAIIDDSSTAGTTTSGIPGTLTHTGTSGAFGITKAGSGILVLTAANIYSGGTTVNAGTLTVGIGGTLGAATGPLAVNNPNAGAGTATVLNLSTSVPTVVGTLSGNVAVPSSGTNTVTINNGGQLLTINATTAGTFAGTIAGSGGLALGTGTQTLTGTNTYSGPTTINSGATLNLGDGATDGSIASTSGVTSSGTLVYNLQTNRAPTYAINGTGGNVTVNGSGQTLTLTNSNGYTGTTTIGSGASLQLGNGTTDGTITNTANVVDNGTLIYNRSTGSTFSSGYVISGMGAVTISGTGVQTLTAVNTYQGVTTINSGATLQLGDGTTGHDGTIASTSGITDNGTLIYNRFGALSTDRVISGIGAVTISGPASQTFTATNSYSGATTISSGATLQLGNGGVSGSLSGTTGITNNGMLVVNRNNPFLGSVDLNGASITGSGGFTQLGSGTTTLDVANTFTGGTVISNGQVSASVSGSLGSGTTGTTSVAIANAATLLLTGSGNLDRVRNDAAINLGGGTVAIASGSSEGTAATVSGGTNSNTGSAFGLGALTLTAANSTLNFDSNGTSTLLVFSSFAPGAFSLNITGYSNSTFDGTANSGAVTDDRLVFNSNLTPAQLAAINFGSGITATEIDLGNGYFEVGQAIPEPASLVYLGATLLGLTGWRSRRKARR